MDLPINTAAAGPAQKQECKGFAGLNLKQFGCSTRLEKLVTNGSRQMRTEGQIGIRLSMEKTPKNEAEGKSSRLRSPKT